MTLNMAQLDYSVTVDCPSCKENINLLDDNDGEGMLSTPIFNNKWDEIKGLDVVCDCGHEFELGGVEY